MRVLIDHKTLKSLFADVFNDKAKLITQIQNRYAIEGYTPKAVEVENGIEIIIDNKALEEQANAHAKAVKAAEQGNYQKAIATLKPIIDKGTLNSEVYRVYAQTLIESQASDGYDELIDALVRNPENEHALVLMGNHYFRLNDDKAATTFFNKAIGVNPDNVQALNNFGGLLLRNEEFKDAIRYFELALEQQPDYTNTFYGIALSNYQLGKWQKAFNWAIEGLKKGIDKSFNDKLKTLANSSAMEYAKQFDWQTAIKPFQQQLEKETGKTVRIELDAAIETTAHIQIAEYKNQPEHLIKYKQDTPFVGHLILHELCHLMYISQARKQNENYLVVSTEGNKEAFERLVKPSRSKLTKMGILNERQDGFVNSLFDGIVLQLYNAPVDLFIEQYIYTNFPDFAPLQFISVSAIMADSIKGPQDKTIQKLTPTSVFNANVAMSMTHAIQIKTLFGLDLLPDFKQPKLIQLAKDLYGQYFDMADDKAPGEEYDLIKWWGEDLKLTPFFKLKKEELNNSTSAIEDVLTSIENDPIEAISNLPGREEEMKTFLEKHGGDDINMAVCMYMVAALEYFEKLSQEKVREIAHQIATIGMNGISPDKKNYTVPLIKGKTFTGYHLLAYYYVSWAIAETEMLPKLGLPFDKEYEMAKKMNNPTD